MASTIELLPEELLVAILDNIEVAELAHLSQCSNYLHQLVEPALYGSTKSVGNNVNSPFGTSATGSYNTLQFHLS
jgi:hypothetical protein